MAGTNDQGEAGGAGLALWRQVARQEIHSVAARFRDELDTPHYGPRAGSWVREAREAADAILDAADGQSWGEFCTRVIAGINGQRDRWRGSEFSDPDGFGGSALGRFASALAEVDADDFVTARAKMADAAKARTAKTLPRHDVHPLPPQDLVPPPRPQSPSAPGRTPSLVDRLAAWWRGGKG